jgi:Fe2+ or Zn2+ uptake regulation protein
MNSEIKLIQESCLVQTILFQRKRIQIKINKNTIYSILELFRGNSKIRRCTTLNGFIYSKNKLVAIQHEECITY